MIIDSHIHRYPDAVIKDPASWAEAHNEFYWKTLVCPRQGKRSLQGWANREQLLSDMDDAGVKRAVILGWYWEHEETCRLQNDWHVQWIKKDPKRLITFASVQPRAGMQVLDDLERAYQGGIRGIGEVFPEVQGFRMQNPVWLKVVEWAIERKLPISMHVTEPVGHHYTGKKLVPLSDYQWLIEAYPDLKLILAHWGGLMPFYELNPAIKKAFKNVYYDTAASPLLYDYRVYRAVVDAVGSDKIVFGSDYPLCLYPKKKRVPNFTGIIEEIKAVGLSSVEFKKIMETNILKVL